LVGVSRPGNNPKQEQRRKREERGNGEGRTSLIDERSDGVGGKAAAKLETAWLILTAKGNARSA
jgi:hypothetical protein